MTALLSSRRLSHFAGAIALALAATLPAAAQSGARAVPSVGAMQDIPEAHEKPDPTLHYKIVFDVETLADKPDQVSPALESIGALINTYRNYGVAADHFTTTAVFHGKTIALVARDAVYAKRTGAKANPNLKLLQELAAAGVQLVVCGQSARALHYVDGDLIPSAQMNLSATVTFLNLQTRGYVKIEE